MNELQRKEFDLLICFAEVCEKLDLPYFLVCGSALGAVKYGGFIPWDDDVDVGLYRKDYERFLKEAPSHLPAHVFLQTYQTDPEYPNIFAKLRDSNTTYIEKSVRRVHMNHGVYIDVFPLDGYPEVEAEQVRLEKRKRYYKRMLSCVYDVERSLKGRVAVCLMRLAGVHKRTAQYLRQYEALIAAYPVEGSVLICNHGNWQGKLEYSPAWHYGSGEKVSFEGLEVRVPQGYDAYLTQKYGDWRADLPVEQQVGHHFYEILNLEEPYTRYQKSNIE